MIFTKCFFIRLTDKILHQLLLQKPHTLPYLNHPNCLAGFCTRVCSSSPSKGPSTLNGTHRPGLKYTTPPENFAKVWGFSTSGCWVKRDTWNIFMKPQQADIPSSERQDPNAPNFWKNESCPKKPGAEAQFVLFRTMTTDQWHTRTNLDDSLFYGFESPTLVEWATWVVCLDYWNAIQASFQWLDIFTQ